MLASLDKLPNQPIVIVRYTAPFIPKEDITAAQEKISEILTKHDGLLFRIDDLSQAEMDWNAFLEGIFIATRDVPGSMTDTRIRGILVGESKMVKMASESMKQDQYGKTETPMFTNLDEAVAYAQNQTEALP